MENVRIFVCVLCLSESATHTRLRVDMRMSVRVRGRAFVAQRDLTEVMYDSVPLHLTLTETHGLPQCCNSGARRLVAFRRINVKRNRNIKLILSALVLRYKVAS